MKRLTKSHKVKILIENVMYLIYETVCDIAKYQIYCDELSIFWSPGDYVTDEI